MKILFCAFPDALREPDPCFQREWEAVDALGIEWRVFSFDAFLDGNMDRAFKFLLPGTGQTLLYRGWILREAEHAALSRELALRGYRLLTSTKQYANTAYLPNYFPHISEWSPPALWTDGPDLESAWKLARQFGREPWIVKDYVKSAKERWHEACFVPRGATKRQFLQVCRKLLEFQGERFERGFVVRPFIPLAFLEESPFGYPLFEEYRLFFLQGRLIASAPYHRVGPELENPAQFGVLGEVIDSPFFSADVARTAAGGLTLIEIGDGGVSGMPPRLDLPSFFEKLAQANAEERTSAFADAPRRMAPASRKPSALPKS